MAKQRIDSIDRSRGFAPAARRDARVLILGSLPGEHSIRAQQYYAQPQNTFWRIMATLTGAGIEQSYAVRLAAMQRAGIALWDVAAAAVRPGSLDAAIVRASVEANDFGALFARCRRIGIVFFNGAKAAELYRRLVLPVLAEPHASLPLRRLPSTSPAHAAMPYAAKLDAWRAVGDYLRDAQSSANAIKTRR